MVKSSQALLFISWTVTCFNCFVDAGPYEGCLFPKAEWATTSFARAATFWTREAHILNNDLIVVGDIRSNTINSTENYSMSGPFTSQDPTGANAITITETVQFPEPSGVAKTQVYDLDIGINVIDIQTGKPKALVNLGPNFHSEVTYAASAATTTNGDVISIGGKFTGVVEVTTDVCTPRSDDNGWHKVLCDGGKTELKIDETKLDLSMVSHVPLDIEGYSSYLMSLHAVSTSDNWVPTIKWAIIPFDGSWHSKVEGSAIDNDGNVLASGQSCDADGESSVCNAMLGKFAYANGDTIWEKKFDEFDRIYKVVVDEETGLLYFSARLLNFAAVGETGIQCSATAPIVGCAVTACADPLSGDVIWARSVNGDAHLYDTGEVKVANPADGPYVYVAHKLMGATGSPSSLDSGTAYAGCKDNSSGALTAEFEISTTKLVEASDCPAGSTYFSRTSEDAIAANSIDTGAVCANSITYGCVMKYHKYTGLPQWGSETVQVRSFETSADGPLCLGSWRPARGDFPIKLNNKVRGNLLFQTLLDKDTGEGVYLNMVGPPSLFPNAAAMDSDGNLYAAIRHFGTSLISDSLNLQFPADGKSADDSTFLGHFMALKFATSPATTPYSPSCFSTCTPDSSEIAAGNCFFFQECIAEGKSSTYDPCAACTPSFSQTEYDDVCTKAPTKAPVKVTGAPVKATAAPVEAPVKLPVKAPVEAPTDNNVSKSDDDHESHDSHDHDDDSGVARVHAGFASFFALILGVWLN